MFTTRAESSGVSPAEIAAFLDKADAEFTAMNTELFADYENEPIDVLGGYPGPVHYPFAWTSDRQFIASRKTQNWGGGIPYQRRNILPTSWEFLNQTGVGIHTFTIRNLARSTSGEAHATFVYGDAADGDPNGYQQVGHILTGWKTARPYIADLFTRMGAEAQTRWNERVAARTGLDTR